MDNGPHLRRGAKVLARPFEIPGAPSKLRLGLHFTQGFNKLSDEGTTFEAFETSCDKVTVVHLYLFLPVILRDNFQRITRFEFCLPVT